MPTAAMSLQESLGWLSKQSKSLTASLIISFSIFTFFVLFTPHFPFSHEFNPELASSHESSTTIVTYYSFVNKSKHSSSLYREWMDGFLRVQSPIVLYCNPPDCDEIVSRREKNLPLKVVRMNHWDTPVAGWMKDAYETKQYSMDPEKRRHSPDLYAIWNNKPFLLSEVAVQNPFNTLYFMWVDIGSFRQPNSPYADWPSTQKLNSIFSGHSSKILLGAITPPDPHRGSTNNTDPRFCWSRRAMAGIQGNFFGGLLNGVRAWNDLYYTTLNQSFFDGFFVGKDQNIMNRAALTDPAMVLLLLSYDGGVDCGTPWWHFLWSLGKPSERILDSTVPKGCDFSVQPLVDVIAT